MYFELKITFDLFTVEEAQALVAANVSEALMHVGSLKQTCQEIVPYLPDGQFKEAMTQALYGVY